MATNNDTNASGAVYWDPYRPDIAANPYPVYRRLRDEAPLYYNKEHDFYAVTRFADVDRCLVDTKTFSSARGDVLEFIKANMEIPPGMFIWEDPPEHTAYRNVVARVFTPKRMNELEQQIRDYCVRCLDPVAGADRIDFIADLGAKLPGGVIGMLLGIPDEDRDLVRERVDTALRTEAGKPMTVEQASYQGEGFEEYIDWREKNPSNDLMTELLNVQFQDAKGIMRKLTRDEILIFVNVLAGAGNETTARLIGWMGKVLSDNPDQRREIAKNPALIPAAVEEVLRVEPPGTQVGRYVTQDVEIHGQIVPAGSVMQFILAAANRDERRFPDGDRFNIHREGPPHITFGRGIHSCLGSALARVEGRVALDELLKRFPDWEVDLDNAKLSSSSTTRGWDTLPAFVGTGRRPAKTQPKVETAPAAEAPAAPAIAPRDTPLEGEWIVTVHSPTGPMETRLLLERKDGELTGSQSGEGSTSPILEASFDNGNIVWTNRITKPMKLKLEFSGVVDGNTMSGKVKTGFMGSFKFTGVKAA